MTSDIIVTPSDVWRYFNSHRSELGADMHLIAQNSDGTVGIYITEKFGDVEFIVEDCDEVIDEDIAVDKDDCEIITKELYSKYLGCEDLDTTDTELEQEIIDEREDEITVLFQNLLSDLLIDTHGEDIIDEIAEDVKEHTLEYIARKYGLPIYRPMYLEDEDGNDFYSEYPYEEMIFDDCNPIYDSD